MKLFLNETNIKPIQYNSIHYYISSLNNTLCYIHIPIQYSPNYLFDRPRSDYLLYKYNNKNKLNKITLNKNNYPKGNEMY